MLDGDGPEMIGTPCERGLHRRTMGAWGIGVLGFLITCAGPFGVEIAIRSAGPLFTLIALVLLPVVWAMPQGMMTAEMSSMEGMDENGGYVLWVQEAFGDCLGFVNGLTCATTNLADLPAYGVLSVDYLVIYLDYAHGIELSIWYQVLIKTFIVIFVFFANARGLESVGYVSLLLTVLVLLPFAIQLVYMGFENELRPSTWLDKSKICEDEEILTYTACLKAGKKLRTNYDWGLFFNTMIWSYMGWDSLGCIAGEVKNPRKSYPRGILIAIVMNTLTYAVPVMTAASANDDYSLYDDGFFVTVAYDVRPWLGAWVVTAAMVSGLAQYNACMATTSRALWALGGGEDTIVKDPIVPRFFAKSWDRFDSPIVAIFFQSLTTSVLMLLPFEFLLEINVFLNNITLFLEMSAWVYFRKYQPDRKRPITVPYGNFGLAYIVIPKTVVMCISMAMSGWLIWLCGGIVEMFIIGAYFLRRELRKRSAARNGGRMAVKLVDDDDDDATAKPPKLVESAARSDAEEKAVRRTERQPLAPSTPRTDSPTSYI